MLLTQAATRSLARSYIHTSSAVFASMRPYAAPIPSSSPLSSLTPTPRNPKWREVVEASFAAQSFMAHLGATLTHASPGAVDITAVASPNLRQQRDFFHAGVTTSVLDSAAGYAALSLFPAGTDVLTTELKVNLLQPAQGDRLVAKGRVIRNGRTLTVCRADVFAVTDVAADSTSSDVSARSGGEQSGTKEMHVATALLTMMQVVSPIA